MPINTKTKVVGGVSGIAGAIIAAVFALEGGYSNDPRDVETNHGITKPVAVANGYTGSMKDLTAQFAEQIYFKDYIQKPGFEPMLELSPAVAEKLVDAGVNVGPSRPSLWFQKGLNSLNRGGQDFPPINADGKVGNGTITAYRSLQKVRGKVKACQLMLKVLDAQQTTFYMSLDNKPFYTVGWIDARIGNVPVSRCEQEGK